MRLLTQYIHLRRFYKKLMERFIGPFTVEKAIKLNIYKFILSELYKRLYIIFYISLLKSYR
jgi:hypothetical protein